MEWMKQTWALLTSWAVTVVAVTQAVRATYAAEHDRQALKQVELKREKLALEVEHLQNRPKIVKERREIYDRLRGTLGEITRDGKVYINHEAAMAMLKFEADMVDIFRPHLKL